MCRKIPLCQIALSKRCALKTIAGIPRIDVSLHKLHEYDSVYKLLEVAILQGRYLAIYYLIETGGLELLLELISRYRVLRVYFRRS